jgi:hypothetical protein
MKTAALIDLLAAQAPAVPARPWIARLALALLLGLTAAAVLMTTLLGVNPALDRELRLPTFWTKAGFAAVLLLGGAWATARLSRPGAEAVGAAVLLVAIVAVIWALAMVEQAGVTAAQRADLLFGRTWRWCPLLIAALSGPGLAGALWALRGLAPTRPALAGAAAGTMAGAAATLVYTLHCPENATTFIAVWYVAGIALPTLAGALLGRTLLRW